MRKFIVTLLCVLCAFIAGCGSSDPVSSFEPISSVQEGVGRPLTMFVQPGTLQMVPRLGRTSQDPANQTPNITLITWVIPASGPCSPTASSYSTTAKQAIMCVTPAQFNEVNADLAQWFSLGKKTKVDLVYNDAGTSTTKPITGISVTTF